MATVPTLISGGTDQTDYIQDKTLLFKRNSLDYTLVDPADSPALNDIVFLDVPSWTGRVSTIESVPFRDAGGDDHRYVRVTATNKNVPGDSDGPFGLSDDPDYATTFPFKDLTVVRTIDTSTTPDTTTLRLTGIVYEPGLLPGMIIPVTVAVESLSGENVHVTEVSVNWLNSENPEYHLDLGKDNAKKPTLQDAFDQAGCGCPSFTCTPSTPDLSVYTYNGSAVMTTIFPNHANGQQATSSAGTSNNDAMYVYAGATYGLLYECFHAAGSNMLYATLTKVGSGLLGSRNVDDHAAGPGTAPLYQMGDIRGPAGCTFEAANDIPIAEMEWTADFTGYVVTTLDEHSCVSGDSYASSLSTHITYLRGPDPRFDTLVSAPCEEGTPAPGQPVDEAEFEGDGTTTDFTTALPFMAGSLIIVAGGVDWTDQITAQDGTLGTYSLAYPVPLQVPPVMVEVRYGYPK